MDRLFRVAYWTALLALAAAILFLVLHYGVNIPFSDQWDFIGRLEQSADGTLRIADLFSQHNEHRMVFPMLIMLALAYLTQWNVVAEMLVSVALAVGSLLVLEALARPVLNRIGRTARLWAAFTISAMLFSTTQWMNWLWGWQVQWFLAVLAAVCAVAFATWSLASARPWMHVAGAIAASVVCQLSIASGVAAWGAAGLILAFHRDRRRILSVWLVAAAVVTGLYLVGYERPSHHPSPLAAFGDPLAFLLYVANYLSGPLARDAETGFAIGVIVVGLGAVAAARHQGEPGLVIPWIALAAFAGANAILTAIGRVGFGSEQALESRYVTISLLSSIALIPLGILALQALTGGRRRSFGLAAGILTATALTIAAIDGDIRGLSDLDAFHRQLATGRDCAIAVADATDDCLRYLYPRAETVRERIPTLQAQGWSGIPKNEARTGVVLTLVGPSGKRG